MNLHAYPEILTVEEVSEYLRTSERTVLNWANEGNLPGGKIGSVWRFRRDDIRRWLNEQIRRKPCREIRTLGDVITREAVFLMDETSKAGALNRMIEKISTTSAVKNQDLLAEAIYQRELMMSTGIGLQVAVPHARLTTVSDLVVCVGLTHGNVDDYDAIDEQPVRLIVMVVARDDQHAEHLQVVSLLSRHMRDKEKRKRVFSSSSNDELFATLVMT